MTKINTKLLGQFFIISSLIIFGGGTFLIAFGCAFGGGDIFIIAKCVASDPAFTFPVFSISLVPFVIGMYLLFRKKFISKVVQ